METVYDPENRLWLVIDQSEDKDTSMCKPPDRPPKDGLYVLSMVVNAGTSVEYTHHEVGDRFDSFKARHKGAFRNFPWRIYQLLL